MSNESKAPDDITPISVPAHVVPSCVAEVEVSPSPNTKAVEHVVKPGAAAGLLEIPLPAALPILCQRCFVERRPNLFVSADPSKFC